MRINFYEAILSEDDRTMPHTPFDRHVERMV